MRPIVVCGTQRSGTAYTAALITACGHWCSHERKFREGRAWSLLPATIESSWAAAPHLAGLDAHVVHQVRHPLAVVASCLARGTFAGKRRRSARWAAKAHPATFNRGDDHVTRIVRYWVRWNQLIEAHAQRRWRLEDLVTSPLGAELVADTLTQLGRPVELGRAAAASDLIPAANASPAVPTVSWDDIPRSTPRREARRMAKRYGYET